MNYRISAAVGVAALALLLGACASSAGQQTASNHRAHEVCSYQSEIGSHIGSRECMSRSAHSAQQKAEYKRTQNQENRRTNTGGPPSEFRK